MHTHALWSHTCMHMLYDHIHVQCTCKCTCTCAYFIIRTMPINNRYYAHTQSQASACVFMHIKEELFAKSNKQCWNASSVYLHTERFVWNAWHCMHYSTVAVCKYCSVFECYWTFVHCKYYCSLQNNLVIVDGWKLVKCVCGMATRSKRLINKHSRQIKSQ